MNSDYLNLQFMTSIREIALRKTLGGYIVVPLQYGRKAKIASILSNASQYLKSPFDLQDIPIVNGLVEKLGLARKNYQKNELANAIVTKLK